MRGAMAARVSQPLGSYFAEVGLKLSSALLGVTCPAVRHAQPAYRGPAHPQSPLPAGGIAVAPQEHTAAPFFQRAKCVWIQGARVSGDVAKLLCGRSDIA